MSATRADKPSGSVFVPLTENEIEELQPAVVKLLREAGGKYPCLDESEFLNQVDALFAMAAASLSLPSPCGHPSQYAYTEDGGAHMVCLLCERAGRPVASTEYTGHAVVMDDPNSAPQGFWWIGIWHDKVIADDIAKKNGIAAHVVPITSAGQLAAGQTPGKEAQILAAKIVVKKGEFADLATASTAALLLATEILKLAYPNGVPHG